jgi:hypothetical protein
MALVVTPVIPPNPPPPATTMGIMIDTTGAIWRVKPNGGLIKIGQSGDTGAISLGAAVAVTGAEEIPAGDWIFVGTGGTTVELIHSDGAATAPEAGHIYQLTQS